MSQQMHLAEKQWKQLSLEERQKIADILLPQPGDVRNVNAEYYEERTFGQRAADAVAKVAGSWSFIIIFLITLLLWAYLNTEVLAPRQEAFDPYPYVFLNLVLSMLAAIQAPIIMMSQNRQSARDRLDAEVDHEVNVRSELAIQEVHNLLVNLQQKIDNAVSMQIK
jgi:uncharacterized membrane protein